MAEADELQRFLLKAQNPDGGWGYTNGSSWTEPTALALLALEARDTPGRANENGRTAESTGAYRNGCAWLAHTQRLDGGWPPTRTVSDSTWVTSLAALALSDIHAASDRCRRGVEWLLGQIKPELGPVERLVFRLRGMPLPIRPSGGSPWFPGTAAWIGPTAMSLLALSDAAGKDSGRQLQSHIADGNQYLLSQRCRDGGWNHGGSKYRSENANSYPEMTGMALLALDGVPPSDLNVSLKLAVNFLRSPGSMEALCWLQLGLARHGIDTDTPRARTDFECRTTRDISLRLLALTAGSANNKFLSRCWKA